MKTAHAITVDHLGEAIVAGRYAVGAVLPAEPLLGIEFGVSRTVVREAVKSLIGKGMLSIRPRVGTRVLASNSWNWFDPDVIAWQSAAGIEPEFIRDLQELRRALEPAAVRLATQRASADDIEAIEQAYQGMEQAVDEGGDYVSQDLKFHQGLLRASGNRDVTMKVFPELNHLFIRQPGGNPAGYTSLTSNVIVPEVIGTLVEWVHAHANTKR